MLSCNVSALPITQHSTAVIVCRLVCPPGEGLNDIVDGLSN